MVIKVFERVKGIKPKKLYVADESRDLQEKEMCDKHVI